jgi:hypothetical protein
MTAKLRETLAHGPATRVDVRTSALYVDIVHGGEPLHGALTENGAIGDTFHFTGGAFAEFP